MNNLPVLLDVDDVLARFIEPIAERFGVRPWLLDRWEALEQIAYLSNTPIKEVFDYIESPGFCANLPKTEHGDLLVNKLFYSGFRIHFVTAPWVTSLHWYKERFDWIKEHYGAYATQHNSVTFTHDKDLVRGEALIDDRYSHCFKWAIRNPSNLAIWIRTQYNRHETQHEHNKPPNLIEADMCCPASVDRIVTVLFRHKKKVDK